MGYRNASAWRIVRDDERSDILAQISVFACFDPPPNPIDDAPGRQTRLHMEAIYHTQLTRL